MNITVQKSELESALKTIKPFITRWTPNVEIYVDDGTYIQAGDTVKSCSVKISSSIEAKGIVSVVYKDLINVLKSISGDISITTEKNDMTISAEGVKVTLFCRYWNESETYFSRPADAVSVSVDFSPLWKVVEFMHPDDTRPTLHALQLRATRDRLYFEAASPAHLSQESVACVWPDEERKFLIPYESARALKGLQNVTIFYSSRDFIEIESGSVRIQTRLIEGTFPDFSVVIPRKWTYEMYVHRKEFLSYIRKAMAGIKGRHVTLERNNDKIQLIGGRTTEDNDLGTFTISVPSLTLTATHNDTILPSGPFLSFHGDNITLCLRSATSDYLSIRFTDSTKPVVLHEGTHTMVTMPLLLP